MAFDPKAPLERQKYKESHHRVLGIAQSPFDSECYLSRSSLAPLGFIRHDMEGKNLGRNSVYDLETIPERKPVIVTYCNQYLTVTGNGYSSVEAAARAAHPLAAIARIKTTFDPNDNSVKSEVVWTPS